MALRPILLHPDPVLRARCAPVAAFGEGLRALVADMFETMYDAPGRGLAAPQVGEALRLFVMDTGWKDGAFAPQIFVNPEIVARSEAQAVHEEACLSIPGQSSRVRRPAEVTLRWQDLDGARREGTFAGIAAVCVQHEYDHLDGVLCIDREIGPGEDAQGGEARQVDASPAAGTDGAAQGAAVPDGAVWRSAAADATAQDGDPQDGEQQDGEPPSGAAP